MTIEQRMEAMLARLAANFGRQVVFDEDGRGRYTDAKTRLVGTYDTQEEALTASTAGRWMTPDPAGSGGLAVWELA